MRKNGTDTLIRCEKRELEGDLYLYRLTAAKTGYDANLYSVEIEFFIRKADYDLSGVYWSDSSFIYNGESHKVEVFGLPAGLRVVGYTDARYTDAGIYRAKALVSYDGENYNEPSELFHSWVIYPGQYDLSGFEFLDTVAEFDGLIHYPTLVGKMPTGLDGSTLSYSFSTGARQVREGRVEVSIRFFTDSKNYIAPAPITAAVSITPRGVSVIWDTVDFIYDGEEKLPRAISDLTAVRVIGGAVNAGIYTARAESLDSNYYIQNSECEFEIRKAKNAWASPPAVGNIYEDGSLTPSAAALSGEVEYKFFSDAAALCEIDAPTLPGRYYMIAHAPETENRLAITSAPIAFEIFALVATELSVTPNLSEYLALTALTDSDLTVYLVYNSGKKERLTLDSLTVIYESGEALCFGDTELTLSYLELTVKMPVKVIKRDYDTSGASWQGLSAVYDGEVKCPTLTGLPDGVTVSYYEGYGSLAGEYTVSAHLNYDELNYNPPKIESAHLVIKKCTLTPTLESVIYDGTAHIPTSPSPLYSIVDPRALTDAGSYVFTVRLTDRDNYTFESGEEASAVFTVYPKVLDLVFPTVTLYLFESEHEVVISVLDGVVSGERVEIRGKIEGERVIYTLNNPNYTLASGEGIAVRLPYPSPRFTWTALFVILFILLIILAVLVLFYRYEDILSALAALRCKRKMRRVLSAPTVPVTPTPPALPTPPTDISFSTPSENSLAIDAERADTLITDSLAKSLLKRPREFVLTSGSGRAVINVDTLSESFSPNDEVDINTMKEKKLIPSDTAYIKVLARGSIDKPLFVRANDFSLQAIKMIALSGGEAIKVMTVKEKRGREN